MTRGAEVPVWYSPRVARQVGPMAPARQDSLLCFRVGGSLFPDPLKLIIWGDSDGEAQRQPFDWRMLASQFPQIEAARAAAAALDDDGSHGRIGDRDDGVVGLHRPSPAVRRPQQPPLSPQQQFAACLSRRLARRFEQASFTAAAARARGGRGCFGCRSGGGSGGGAAALAAVPSGRARAGIARAVHPPRGAPRGGAPSAREGGEGQADGLAYRHPWGGDSCSVTDGYDRCRIGPERGVPD